MDFDNAKENIQPLATGRNASILQAALNADSHEELNKQREILESAIHNYDGDDPLEPWFQYILWTEQSYPTGGTECGLKKLLLKCLEKFETEQKYFQDRRMIRVYIKFIDSEPNPQELYQELFNAGIGTMVADLYICWAYYYDLAGNFQKAESIFRRGLEVRAEPYDELDQAHKHFGYTVSQRIFYQDDSSKEEFLSSLLERRHALTSLKAHKKKVGSIRLGRAVKSQNPGKIEVDANATSDQSRNNRAVQVFDDENHDPNVAIESEIEVPKSLVRNIIDSARKQENMREAGPWSKALLKKRGPLIGNADFSQELGFKILEDDLPVSETQFPIAYLQSLPLNPNNYAKGIKLPANFKSKNFPQSEWKVSTVSDNENRSNGLPTYHKSFHYPKPNHDFSLEEYLFYKWLKKRKITNAFTEVYDLYWANDYSVGIRIYPNFASKNLPQIDALKLSEVNLELPENMKFAFNIDEYYPKNGEEMQMDEILYSKWIKGERKLKFDGNETIMRVEEMDETTCLYNVVNRKSIFPSRKSMAAFGSARKSCMRAPAFPNSPVLQEDSLENEYSAAENSVCNESQLRRSVIIENPIRAQARFENSQIPPADIPKILKERVQFPSGTENDKICQKLQSIAIIDDTENVATEPPAICTEFEIYTDPTETLPIKTIEKTAECSPVLAEPFQIYTDDKDTENRIGAPTNNEFQIFEDIEGNFEFKAPAPRIVATKQKLPLQVLHEEELDNVETENIEGAVGGFDPNETCSTQTFNLFIKAQSVSTPVNIRKQILQMKQTSSEKSVEISPTLALSPPDCAIDQQTLPFKQLSTILETTETNTASTKSSVETHLSTGESYKDLLRSNNIHPQPSEGILVDYNQVEKSLLPINTATTSSINLKHCLNYSDVAMNLPTFADKLNKSTEKNTEVAGSDLFQKSIKFFEEKTETVPKIMLKKQSDLQIYDQEMLDFFSKTPEKCPSKSSIKPNTQTDGYMWLTGNESVKLNDLTLSKKFIDFGAEEKDSPYSKVRKTATIPKSDTSDFFDFFNKTPKPLKKKEPMILSDNADCGMFAFPKLDELALPKELDTISNLSFLSEDVSTKKTDFGKVPNKSKIGNLSESFSLNMSGKCFPPKNNESVLTDNVGGMKLSFLKQPETETLIGHNTSKMLEIPANPQAKTVAVQLNPENENEMIESMSLAKASDCNLPSHSKNMFGNKSRLSIFNVSKQPALNEPKIIPSTQTSSLAAIKQSVKNTSIDGSEESTQSGPFAPNLTGIKNSTWLPNHNFYNCNIQENSLHIKEEIFDEIPLEENINYKLQDMDLMVPLMVNSSVNQFVVEHKQNEKDKDDDMLHEDHADDLGRSVYIVGTPKTPQHHKHHWSDDGDPLDIYDKEFIFPKINLDQTNQYLGNAIDFDVNPFSTELIAAFVDHVDILNYIDKLPTCELKRKIAPLKKGSTITINEHNFEISKIIGEGSYGTIFCGKDLKSKKQFAFKQEKPANLWEYYICLELQSRIANPDILRGFMEVEYALIGNNASILVSEFSTYGSLITVCNKIKRYTSKNIDEYVVMILVSQILSIIDHLHASNIIHADLKPDNFLVMNRISFDARMPSVQLIDFGVSIDLDLYPKSQKFSYIHASKDFQCIEMRENRPWTFQTDLYGVAGTTHVLLYGKYMDVKKTPKGNWMPIEPIRRYLNKTIWERIFNDLINIPDCYSMPNLQNLRKILEQGIADNEKYVKEKILFFNHTMDQ